MAGLTDPFTYRELRGFFYWDAAFTDDLREHDPWMYTAMHEAKLRRAVSCGRLKPRGHFDVTMGGEEVRGRCCWLALQDWHSFKGHNYFGPFVLSIPLRKLVGRRFYVYERDCQGWRRFYFVQREEKTRLFTKGTKRLNPRRCFTREPNGALCPSNRTQYEILVTESVPLASAKVEATGHEWCGAVADRCGGHIDRRDAIEQLEGVLERELMPPGARRFPQPFPLRDVISRQKFAMGSV